MKKLIACFYNNISVGAWCNNTNKIQGITVNFKNGDQAFIHLIDNNLILQDKHYFNNDQLNELNELIESEKIHIIVRT